VGSVTEVTCVGKQPAAAGKVEIYDFFFFFMILARVDFGSDTPIR